MPGDRRTEKTRDRERTDKQSNKAGNTGNEYYGGSGTRRTTEMVIRSRPDQSIGDNKRERQSSSSSGGSRRETHRDKRVERRPGDSRSGSSGSSSDNSNKLSSVPETISSSDLNYSQSTDSQFGKGVNVYNREWSQSLSNPLSQSDQRSSSGSPYTPERFPSLSQDRVSPTAYEEFAADKQKGPVDTSTGPIKVSKGWGGQPYVSSKKGDYGNRKAGSDYKSMSRDLGNMPIPQERLAGTMLEAARGNREPMNSLMPNLSDGDRRTIAHMEGVSQIAEEYPNRNPGMAGGARGELKAISDGTRTFPEAFDNRTGTYVPAHKGGTREARKVRAGDKAMDPVSGGLLQDELGVKNKSGEGVRSRKEEPTRRREEPTRRSSRLADIRSAGRSERTTAPGTYASSAGDGYRTLHSEGASDSRPQAQVYLGHDGKQVQSRDGSLVYYTPGATQGSYDFWKHNRDTGEMESWSQGE